MLEEDPYLLVEETARSKYLRPSDYLQLRYREVKLQVLQYYSKSKMPVCSLCGFTNILALSIDHIGGGGNAHRRELAKVGYASGGSGYGFYRWLINNKWPSGFRVLCMNCQFTTKTSQKGKEKKYARK